MNDKPGRRGRRPSLELTDPQRRTLAEIQDWIVRHSVPPTIQELADALGIAPASAHDQVNQLVKKGFLKREPRKARSLSVVRQAAAAAPAQLVSIPILGTVVAGSPLLAEENVLGEVLVESRLASTGKHFALRVQGDSMKNAGMVENDLLIVRQQPVAENGDIVVALLNGEATVKRLSIQGHVIELRPENPRYRPIVVDPDADLRVLGKVVAIRSVQSE
ncbi:MAG: transcriptional repressor LexA [Planctomycetota bacterium]|nr:transcriptional repressor LexA [Planctomycetota bacterium]